MSGFEAEALAYERLEDVAVWRVQRRHTYRDDGPDLRRRVSIAPGCLGIKAYLAGCTCL